MAFVFLARLSIFDAQSLLSTVLDHIHEVQQGATKCSGYGRASYITMGQVEYARGAATVTQILLRSFKE